jgi:hypothetical protein
MNTFSAEQRDAGSELAQAHAGFDQSKARHKISHSYKE